jgi:hypothetical protein
MTMKACRCHLARKRKAHTFWEGVSTEIALVKTIKEMTLFEAIQSTWFQPTMIGGDGAYLLAIGTCDACGDDWVMQMIRFDDEENPGIYYDFVYTETRDQSEKLIQDAQSSDDIANSVYTTLTNENYRRFRKFLKPPYSTTLEVIELE